MVRGGGGAGTSGRGRDSGETRDGHFVVGADWSLIGEWEARSQAFQVQIIARVSSASVSSTFPIRLAIIASAPRSARCPSRFFSDVISRFLVEYSLLFEILMPKSVSTWGK